jgi:glycosyltransferase involved in cell wall biosynthesis
MGEERDRAGNEMRRLVDVVAVGEALLDAPQAQQEGDHQQGAERQAVRVGQPGARGAQVLAPPATGSQGQRTGRFRLRPGQRCRVHLVLRVSRYRVGKHLVRETLHAGRGRGAAGPQARPKHMKLIIQIPCFNEQDQLPVTLSRLPRRIEGFDALEWLIIDDGSTDATVEVACANGVNHIVRLTNNKGLAAAFQAGLDAGLKLGADVIVNTDADNQYEGQDIPKLVAPILRGDADMVIGDRQIDINEHFSPAKRMLQRLGSWVVRQASSTEVPDTTSGFRAYNREAALQMQVVSKFTYTLETIIQAGKLLVAIDHVPIRTNAKTRESRLFPSMPAYIRRNGLSIFRIYSQYEPLKVFWGGATVMGVAALAVFIRFLIYFIEGSGRGHVQSLIAGAVLIIGAMLLGSLGVIGDLLDAQRTLSQRTFERVRRIELQLGVQPSHYEPGAPPSDATQPQPTPAGGDGSATQPQPTPAGGDGSATQPQPTPAGGDGSATQPQPTPAGGDGSATQPQPTPDGGDGSAGDREVLGV